MSNTTNDIVEQSLRLVLTTCESKDQARSIAQQLISERHAACVSILPGIESVYEWRGKVENSKEFLLFIKTSAQHVNQLFEKLSEIHPYDTPEIISLKPTKVAVKYLNWVYSVTEEK